MKKTYFLSAILFSLIIFMFSCKLNSEPEVVTLNISSFPDTMSFYQNDVLDLTGLEVQAVYSDGRLQTVEDFTTEPAENSLLTKTGKQKITVKALNTSVNFKITVLENAVSSLSVYSYPNKQIYKVGESLSLEGLILIAEYNNGIEKYISTDEITSNPSEGTVLSKTGTKSIELKYLTKKMTLPVTVQEKDPEYAELPVIVTQPQNQKSAVNEQITISVTAKEPDEGTLEYQWYKGSEIYNSFELLSGENLPAISIINDGTESSQYYYCVVKNRTSGKLVSETESDKVLIEFVEPVTIISQTADISFELYSDFTMPALKADFKVKLPGTVTIQWYKKAQNDGEEDELLKEENQINVYSDEGCAFTTEYQIPDDEFGTNEVNSHYFYAKTIFEDSYTTLSPYISLACILPETGLKTIIINTDSGKDPTGVYLKTLGLSSIPAIADKEKLSGNMKVFLKDELLYDSGNHGMSIKLRGNGSAYYAKKPFKITLNDETALLNNNIKYKDWCLLVDGYSTQSLFALFGFMTAKICGFNWVPEFEYVDLILNNTYRGTYMLCESVEQNQNKIDVSKDGYIIERDIYVKLESTYNTKTSIPVYFTTNTNKNYSFKFPDDSNLTQNRIDYITNCMNNFETSLENNNYDELIDVNSWSLWFLVHDIIGMGDTGGTNKYISKYDSTEESKLYMNTPWDFSSKSVFKREGYWTLLHDNSNAFYGPSLFNSSNRAFVESFQNQWRKISPTLYTDSEDYLNEFYENYGEQINKSKKLDGKRWKRNDTTIEYDIKKIKNWLTSRITWINENIDNL